MSRLSSTSRSTQGLTEHESESPSGTRGTTAPNNPLDQPGWGRLSPLPSNLNINWGAGSILTGVPSVGGGNFVTKDVISLDSIRSTLIRQVGWLVG